MKRCIQTRKPVFWPDNVTPILRVELRLLCDWPFAPSLSAERVDQLSSSICTVIQDVQISCLHSLSRSLFFTSSALETMNPLCHVLLLILSSTIWQEQAVCLLRAELQVQNSVFGLPLDYYSSTRSPIRVQYTYMRQPALSIISKCTMDRMYGFLLSARNCTFLTAFAGS